MSKVESFFSSYEDVLMSAYENIHAKYERTQYRESAAEEEELKKTRAEAAARWEAEPLEELDGRTPVQYLETVSRLDDLLDMFQVAPVLCDEELPDIYLNKLKACGEAAVDALLGIAADEASIEDEEELFLVPLMALKILGSWKVEKAIDPMMQLLDRESVNYDIFAEQVKASLVCIGAPALEPVMSALESRESGSSAYEYLLMALAEIGNTHKSELVYRCLKNAFQSMDNKMIGALCLKSYGDGRAVPALRGYLEKNRGKVDQETFYEIISVIRSLGGSIDGLQ